MEFKLVGDNEKIYTCWKRYSDQCRFLKPGDQVEMRVGRNNEYKYDDFVVELEIVNQ